MKFTTWIPNCGETEDVSGVEFEADSAREAAEYAADNHFAMLAETPKNIDISVRTPDGVKRFECEPEVSVDWWVDEIDEPKTQGGV